MASFKDKLTADFFKKDLPLEISSREENGLDTSHEQIVDKISNKTQYVADYETSSEDEAVSDDEIEKNFIYEDRLISRLYREVVDDIMASNKLRESSVDNAIQDMKSEIKQGHKKGFRRFAGIDFRKPENCCGYLRRYAICHTGLVKMLMRKFFSSKNILSIITTHEIMNNSHLKVVSLGGGPGNDLVGFCSALQETSNNIEQLQMIVVDISKGWKTVFPKILVKAKGSSFGSFSECLQKKITTGFMEADLTKRRVFKDENLSFALGQADVLLMVKLTSFLSDEESSILIHNVVKSMSQDTKLIFIDHPYDEHFFRVTEDLDCLYHDCLKYEICFNPKKSHTPSIENAYAHIAVLQKKTIQSEDSSDDPDDIKEE